MVALTTRAKDVADSMLEAAAEATLVEVKVRTTTAVVVAPRSSTLTPKAQSTAKALQAAPEIVLRSQAVSPQTTTLVVMSDLADVGANAAPSRMVDTAM